MPTRTSDPKTRVHVRIPLDVQAQIDLVIADPLTGRSRYGKLSDFYVEALKFYLNHIERV